MTRLIVVSLLLVSLTAANSFAASFQGVLVKVSDGDTVQVMHNGKSEKVRLAEIDCPEEDQPYGKAAKRYVLDLAAQKVVTVEVTDTDRYGRTVGEVTLPDGKSLNREIVKAGYAWWYRKYSKDASLGELEEEARRARRGLWQDKNPTPPWEWRATQRSGSHTAIKAATSFAGSGFHGNVKSGVFHQPSCESYNCKNCSAVFGSREEAIAAGYKLCGKCRP